MCSVLLAALLSIGMFVLTPSAQAAGTGAMAGVVVTSSGRLNVRSAQSTSSSVIASLDKGSYVTLISQSGSWWQVEYAKGEIRLLPCRLYPDGIRRDRDRRNPIRKPECTQRGGNLFCDSG